LDDRFLEIRDTAVVALSGYDTTEAKNCIKEYEIPENIKHLVTMMDFDPGEYGIDRAIQELSEVNNPWIVFPLLHLMNSYCNRWYKFFSDIERVIGDLASEKYVPNLISFLDEDRIRFNRLDCQAPYHLYAKRLAIKTLGNLKDKRAIKSVSEKLLFKEYDLRVSAVEALKKLEWKPSLDQKGAIFWAHEGEWEKCVTIGELSIHPLLFLLEDAVHRLDSKKDDDEQILHATAARALGEMKVKKAITLFEEMRKKLGYSPHYKPFNLELYKVAEAILAKAN